MSLIHDAIEAENIEKSAEQGRMDAYYNKPYQPHTVPYPEQYKIAYDEVKMGDNWRYKPAWE